MNESRALIGDRIMPEGTRARERISFCAMKLFSFESPWDDLSHIQISEIARRSSAAAVYGVGA
jgi:hypothetical protein